MFAHYARATWRVRAIRGRQPESARAVAPERAEMSQEGAARCGPLEAVDATGGQGCQNHDWSLRGVRTEAAQGCAASAQRAGDQSRAARGRSVPGGGAPP